ncbi:hypothetical protein [Gluconobacter cerinus]|uniref:hypothetical protein n=1 Tax=Gluconobacter cerinus TaxID=38307 RepID=UPI0030DD5DDF
MTHEMASGSIISHAGLRPLPVNAQDGLYVRNVGGSSRSAYAYKADINFVMVVSRKPTLSGEPRQTKLGTKRPSDVDAAKVRC